MFGLSAAAPSGVLRSCSSFCCARAWAAQVESALFSLWVSEIVLAANAIRATARNAVAATASSSEKPPAERLADRGLAEHIDGHRPGPGAAHGDRDRHLRAKHAPRVEDGVAGQYRAELCALRHGLGRGVGDPVARLLALDRVRGMCRVEVHPVAHVARDRPLAGGL